MSKLDLVHQLVKRNRSKTTQTFIFSAAGVVSSVFMAASTFYSAGAVQTKSNPLSSMAAAQAIAASPVAKSTFAPLEDSVQTIAKVTNPKVFSETEKTQEILDKAKPVDQPGARAGQSAGNNAGLRTVPVPDELPQVAVAPTSEIASTPASLLQPAVAVSSPGTSYPYASVPFPNAMADPWGMYMRQCVSYTAWKVASSGRHMPYWGGRGNAAQWVSNAWATGIPVDGYPRVGDVAIASSYGHASYVEAVYGDGTILISQYNAHWDGAYSEERRSSAGLSYIHF